MLRLQRKECYARKAKHITEIQSRFAAKREMELDSKRKPKLPKLYKEFDMTGRKEDPTDTQRPNDSCAAT